MAGFTANIPGAAEVTGSTPLKQSSAAAIGSALGGVAKILDVGLKEYHQERSDKLGSQLEDQLAGVVQPIGGKQGDVFQDQLNDIGYTGQGFGQIAKLAQANRHSPDKVSTAQMMGKAAQITQQMIHDNPRYADEIRSRAQKILGVNPTEEVIKQNLKDEDALEAQQRAFKLDAANDAMRVGILIPDGKGGYNLDAMASAGMTIKKTDHDMEQMGRQLAQEKDRIEIENLQNKRQPETDKARSIRVQSTLLTTLDPLFNAQMDGAMQSLNIGKFLQENTNAPAGAEAKERDTIRAGLSSLRTSFLTQFDRYMANLSATPEGPIVPEDQKAVRDMYVARFSQWEDLLDKSPIAAFKAQVDAVAALKAGLGMKFIDAAPLPAAIAGALGDNAVAPAVQVALASNDKANGAFQGQITNWINGAAAVANPTPGQPIPPLTKDVTNILNAGMGVYASRPDKLTPIEKAAYGNITTAYVEAGMRLLDVGQLGTVMQQTSAPTRLRLFDNFAKDPAHADQAQKLGSDLFNLNIHYIQQATAGLPNLIASQQFRMHNTSMMGGRFSDVNGEPVYNTKTGQVELEFSDVDGNRISPSRVTIPLAATTQLRMLNQSLKAAVHVKDYAADDAKKYSEEQLKQSIIDTVKLPLAEGSERIKMPEEEKPASPTSTTTLNDNGWSVDIAP